MYNALSLRASAGKEVIRMDFLQAVGASAVGSCLFKVTEYVVKLIKDRL